MRLDRQYESIWIGRGIPSHPGPSLPRGEGEPCGADDTTQSPTTSAGHEASSFSLGRRIQDEGIRGLPPSVTRDSFATFVPPHPSPLPQGEGERIVAHNRTTASIMSASHEASSFSSGRRIEDEGIRGLQQSVSRDSFVTFVPPHPGPLPRGEGDLCGAKRNPII